MWQQHRYQKLETALKETLSAEFKKLGNSAQTREVLVDYSELESRLKVSLGKEVMDEIQRTNGRISSLTTAVGEVKASVENLKPVEGTKTSNGSFSTSLEQNRGALPSLTTLQLNYDASQPGLTGLKGAWLNNSEIFTASFGSWRTEKGGLRNAVSLKRDVYNSAGVKIGSEPIEVQNADSYISSDTIQSYTTPPKYTIFLGGSLDSRTKKTAPSVYIDTKIYKNLGVTAGYVNHGYLLGGSLSFGRH
jgi:hypothetical protein